MWKSCDTCGMLVFLHALWHPWLLRCVVVRVVTPFFVLSVRCVVSICWFAAWCCLVVCRDVSRPVLW